MEYQILYHDESESVGTRAKKKLFGMVYSRTALVLGLVLLQIVLMVVFLYRLSEYSGFYYGVVIILTVGAIIFIINDNVNPAFKLTWLLLILVFPLAGAGLYMFKRVEVGTRYIGERLGDLAEETKPYLRQDESIVNAMKGSRVANNGLSHFLSERIGCPTYGNTEVKYFPLGDDKFPALLEELSRAQRFIFMEYFIVSEGVMWNTILKILEKKARQGVEIRFMYDGMNSVSSLPADYPEKLEKRGIRCKQFAPIRPVMSTSQNNRDHRKICVIDGKVAFTGGVNLADEYINQKVRFGHWKDTAVMLKGDAVQSFTMMFLQMWNVTEEGQEDYERYLTRKRRGFDRELGYVLPYADSPFDNENVGEEVYMHILNHSRKYVHIMTPYLILDYEMVTALTRAAKSGIEVKIIMPHIPDKAYAFHLAKTYYKELIAGGVQIYEYTPGFVHAKVFVSDDDTATVGTINLDYRSLYLHFECGVFIYRNPVVRDIEADFQRTLEKCQKISLVDVNNRPVIIKLYGQVLRLIAPLM